MRVLFLNQYFPPDPAPTGVLLAELAERLRADGHEVEFVGSGKAYRAGPGSGSRLRREAGALLQMLRAGLRAPRAEVVISASSPPCLLIAATLIAWRHRARSVHWAMDLYPELAVALGEIPRGVLANCCLWIMRWCYRRTDVIVALDEDMATHLRDHGLKPEICRPWVFAPVLAQLGEAASESVSEPWTWLYSGNLGRAHEWETLLEAQALIEAADPSIHLAFQGSGPATQPAQERARALGLRRCTWRGYVDEAELPRTLLRAAVTVATQRPGDTRPALAEQTRPSSGAAPPRPMDRANRWRGGNSPEHAFTSRHLCAGNRPSPGGVDSSATRRPFAEHCAREAG